MLPDLVSKCFATDDENVLMHLQVRGASRPNLQTENKKLKGLNAPTGAWCFPTGRSACSRVYSWSVLMHLQVRGASRQQLIPRNSSPIRLNAPTGAWCFPTLALEPAS